MLIDQEALELIHNIKIDLGLVFSSRKTGSIQARLDVLKDAYRAAWQRNASACARLLGLLHSKDHGAGDGLPQLLRVLGDAVDFLCPVCCSTPQANASASPRRCGFVCLIPRLQAGAARMRRRSWPNIPVTAGCTKHMWS